MYFEEDKLIECIKLLKPILVKPDNNKKIFTIIKSLGYGIDSIKDVLHIDEDIWYNIKPNERWKWNDLLEIIKDNTTDDIYNELIEHYFYDEEKLIFEGDKGLSKLIANIMRNKLIIINEKGDGYLLNKETNQYDKKLKFILVDMVTDIISPVLNKIADNINKEKKDWDIDNEDNDITNPYKKKLKELKKIKTMINTTAGCSKVYKAVIPRLLNLEFEKNINIINILSFIQDICEVSINNDTYRVEPHLLYQEYKNYCQNKNMIPTDSKKFGSYMIKRFGKSIKITVNKKRLRFYLGIKLSTKIFF